MQNFRMCLQISRSAVEDDVSALHHVSAAIAKASNDTELNAAFAALLREQIGALAISSLTSKRPRLGLTMPPTLVAEAEFRWLQDGKIGGLVALQYACNVFSDLPIRRSTGTSVPPH
jgi:hypothetical protein